jgi:hypothetical protein
MNVFIVVSIQKETRCVPQLHIFFYVKQQQNTFLQNKEICGIIKLSKKSKLMGENKMGNKRKLFCEYGPICYKISLYKEAKKKDLKDLKARKKFAKKISKDNLEYIWKGDTKLLLRKLHGVDMQLQKNKVKNLRVSKQKD